MIRVRPFRNTDPPQLAEVWRSQPPSRGLMQPMSVAVLERMVYSKPIFDRLGLLVALEGERIVGFAHCGFGPRPDEQGLSTERGVISLIMLRPEVEPAAATPLVEACEEYLRSRGARDVIGGGRDPWSPFYNGLYGGSEITGVLASDVRGGEVLAAGGFRPQRRSVVLQRDLAGFRPLVDRQQMQIRRQTTLGTRIDPPSPTWWDAILFEPFERIECFLTARDSAEPVARAYFWSMDTMLGAWGVHAVGIVGLEVSPKRRRQGLATFLMGESLRQLQAQGVALAEVHIDDDNTDGLGLFGRLGFSEVDRAVVYCKDSASIAT